METDDKADPVEKRAGSKMRDGGQQDKDGTWKVSPYSLFHRRLATEQLGNMVVRSSVTMAPNQDSVSEWKLNMEQSKVACSAGGEEVIYVKSNALQPELPALHSPDAAVRRSSVMRLQEIQIEKPLHEEIAAARNELNAADGEAEVEEASKVLPARSPRTAKLKPVEGVRSPLNRSLENPRLSNGGFPNSANFGSTWSPGRSWKDGTRTVSPKSSPWSPRSQRKSHAGIKLKPVWDFQAIKDLQYSIRK